MEAAEFYRAKFVAEAQVIDEVTPWWAQKTIFSADLASDSDLVAGKQTNQFQQLLSGPGVKVPISGDNILHIGDSMEADLCGAKAAGLHGVFLDRSGDPNVRQYQDWLEGPDYVGK